MREGIKCWVILFCFVLFFFCFPPLEDGGGAKGRKDSFRVMSFDCFNSCCAKEICKTKAEINTKKLRKKIGGDL